VLAYLLSCLGVVVAVGEISMAYFHQTNTPERTAQIDTIGWVFVAFVVAITSITGIALCVSLSQ
jgi:hypothetical protein